MPAPGRVCPVAYRYRPEDLAEPPAFACTTLHVVGGLYGNPYALDAVLARAAAEPVPPEIVFNGDLHYLDVDADRFRAVEAGVRPHHAVQGNVEYALVAGDDSVGCGCDYPDYVPDAIVTNSNLVVERLRASSGPADTGVRDRLAALPRHLTVAVGDRRVGIVHGDPESLAGWRLALEALDPPDEEARARTGFTGPTTTADQVADWCRRAGVDALCCTHTGLPYAQVVPHAGRRSVVVNNGCAGLPNFAGSHVGVVTRLSADPQPPDDSLYGSTLDGLRVDALPVRYDHDRWWADFLRSWPSGSPAHDNYATRIQDGTWLTVEHAARDGVTLSRRSGCR
ncbi:metallophosphoesterase family protein [Pseudonocardia halophobica]|uniref:metallophosphoesterase family protein n=1 Tax=Pseudonocardia halophobica TaxID=29401 RepID=UPI003D8CD5B9